MDGDLIGQRHGVVLPVRVDASGRAGPTKREAAGPEWRTSSRGRFVRAHVVPTPAQRVAEIGVILPPRATPTGWASLAWQEGWWFSGLSARGDLLPVQVAAPRRLVRPQDGFVLCRERWDPKDVVVVDGLAVASGVRATCFSMRYARTLEAAVTALDMAAFHDLVSVDEVRAWVDLHPSYTGIEQARLAVALADENAWSPAEPQMRLLWVRTGFPVPLTNRPVFDLDGRLLGTPDLVDPVSGVLGEYDGSLHLEGARRAVDLKREHAFRAHGLEPVVMVAADRADPEHVIARLRTAYARAEARPASERRWTLELPSWWTPTFTVAQRRALPEHLRGRLLWNRAAPGLSDPSTPRRDSA